MAILFAFSLVPAMFSPMIMDSAGTGGNDTGLWLAFSGAISIPVVIVLSILASWILFFFKRYRAAILINLLPVINLVLVTVGFMIVG
jgi:hypothetical protein